MKPHKQMSESRKAKVTQMINKNEKHHVIYCDFSVFLSDVVNNQQLSAVLPYECKDHFPVIISKIQEMF